MTADAAAADGASSGGGLPWPWIVAGVVIASGIGGAVLLQRRNAPKTRRH